MAASREAVDLSIVMMGVTEIKLITNPNHMVSQEEEEITISVPIIVVDERNRMKVGLGGAVILKFSVIYEINGVNIKQTAIIRGRIIAHAVHIRLS